MNGTKQAKTSGMLLGKFMPPHIGHVYLANFAKNYVDELTIVVGSLKNEPLPGELRFQWMKTLFPDCNVVHLTDENPQYPEEHPDFWQIWHDSLMSVLPCKPDFVFCGEDYGAPLAQTLGAEFIPSNLGRSIIPTSATNIRENPLENWHFIPEKIRPYFLKKICLMGPESTGKTTLSQKLANAFETLAVPEYAYSLIKLNNGEIQYQDIEKFARGQIASQDALAFHANKLLICDTDLITTHIWSEILFDKTPPWIKEEIEERPFDLYLLQDPETPWLDDVHRIQPNSQDRKDFFQKSIDILEHYQRPYHIISGNWQERFTQNKTAITKLLTISTKKID